MDLKDQGAAVAGAVPVAVGAGPLGVGIGALVVGLPVGEAAGVAVSDGVGVPVGNEVGAGNEVSVRDVAVGVPSCDFFVACGVVVRGLGGGVLVPEGDGVIATVGTEESRR